jgi:hypothetical protein
MKETLGKPRRLMQYLHKLYSDLEVVYIARKRREGRKGRFRGLTFKTIEGVETKNRFIYRKNARLRGLIGSVLRSIQRGHPDSAADDDFDENRRSEVDRLN